MAALSVPATEDSAARAAACIRRGGIVCFPTEGTYGLAVRAEDGEALARLFALKGRPRGSPFALIAPGEEAARSFARAWPERAAALAAHWPAPLTLVLPARRDLPGEIVGPGGGVGVRVSPHPFADALARAVGAPITATSANPAGARPAESIEEARRYFGDAVELYADGGPSARSEPSTVIALDERGGAEILRAGAFDLGAAGIDLA